MSAATPLLPPLTPPACSQADAIAFEAARECLTDVMAIVSAELDAPDVSADRAQFLTQQLAALHRERAALAVGDRERVAAVRQSYGQQVRAYRAERGASQHGH